MSRIYKIYLFNGMKTQSDKESLEGHEAIRPKFKVNVDCLTCVYPLRLKASLVVVFIGEGA